MMTYSAMVGLIAIRIWLSIARPRPVESAFSAFPKHDGLTIAFPNCTDYADFRNQEDAMKTKLVIGIVLIVCFPRGVRECPDRR